MLPKTKMRDEPVPESAAGWAGSPGRHRPMRGQHRAVVTNERPPRGHTRPPDQPRAGPGHCDHCRALTLGGAEEQYTWGASLLMTWLDIDQRGSYFFSIPDTCLPCTDNGRTGIKHKIIKLVQTLCTRFDNLSVHEDMMKWVWLWALAPIFWTVDIWQIWMYSIYWRAESRSEANSKQESGDNKHAEICLMSAGLNSA